MKRTILLSAFLILVGMTFAQMKKDRTSAYNYWQKGDLLKAKEFIDKATAYPEAATDAKVWYYKGGIYLDLQMKPEFKILAPDALNISYDSYIKSKALDAKDEYKSDIVLRMQQIGGQLFNEGINFFTANDIDNALTNFERAISIGSDNKIVDTLAIYGSALCYEKKGEKAKAISTYESLISMQMNEKSVYSSLAMLYKENGEFEKATNTIENGLVRYPGDNDLIITQANLYISTNQHEKALISLGIAKEKEPNNTSIQYAIGVTYDLLKNDTMLPQADRDKYFNEAIKAYEETLKQDPTFFDALFNLGVLFFNKGGDIINAANKLPLSETKKFDELMAQGNVYLNKALPYFEDGEKINPNDKQLLVSLKEIYTRLNMLDKMKAVNDKLQ
ncbi:MAG: tetratricopeptide repeat protein [Bacteroidales bacterium]|nr:tetratricopeptide repeat protein [Bacteroidales bacterium]